MVKDMQTNKIWEILEGIPDPEVPVISIVELGVVRDVIYSENQLTISITPTYSGCPAMYFIKDEITKSLESKGYENLVINTLIAPAWTTDWMDKETKNKLKKEGIAPPEKNIICPLCDSKNIDLISEFSSTACKAMYKCDDCLEPFEHFKCI